MNRFRPNIIVDGCHPYSEDLWKTIKIGKLTFLGVKLCDRCKVKLSALVLCTLVALKYWFLSGSSMMEDWKKNELFCLLEYFSCSLYDLLTTILSVNLCN
jgi:hypothetical protein